MRRVELARDLVILTCAISAGIHGALVPGHFAEGTAAGVGFATATVSLAAVAVAVTLRPTNVVNAATIVLLAGLLLGYALAATTGLPVLHSDREPVDGLGLATKGVELVGLLAASTLIRRPSVAATLRTRKGKTTWTRRERHAQFLSS